MATSVPLKKSLRKIPAFRSLSGRELEAIIDRMVCKTYEAGQILWRTSAQMDFVGIIQEGEIQIDYQLNGAVIRSTRLAAGDLILPRALTAAHSVATARAATRVNLFVLDIRQIQSLQTEWSQAQPILPSMAYRKQQLTDWSWAIVVALVILLVTWNDLTRVISGMLYLASRNASAAAATETHAFDLLSYAQLLDQKAVFIHNQEGYLWFQNDNISLATSAFYQAVSIDPHNGPALNNLGVTLFRTDQATRAAVYLKQAALNDPDTAVIKYNLGIVLMNQKRNAEAMREFREAIFINPSWAAPYIQEGYIFLQTGEFARAEQAAAQALKLDSSQRSAYMIHAIALFNQEKYHEALKPVEQALQIAPNDATLRYYQARIMSKLGNYEAALSILEQLRQTAKAPEKISRFSAEIEALHRFLQYAPAQAQH